jgi:hypothetical protein
VEGLRDVRFRKLAGRSTIRCRPPNKRDVPSHALTRTETPSLAVSMSVSVAGLSAQLFYCSDARPSRASERFANVVKRTSWSPYGRAVPLSLTVPTADGCFTGVIDFVIDPLCQVDLLLGGGWPDMCMSNGLSPGIESLRLYHCSEPFCGSWMFFLVQI